MILSLQICFILVYCSFVYFQSYRDCYTKSLLVQVGTSLYLYLLCTICYFSFYTVTPPIRDSYCSKFSQPSASLFYTDNCLRQTGLQKKHYCSKAVSSHFQPPRSVARRHAAGLCSLSCQGPCRPHRAISAKLQSNLNIFLCRYKFFFTTAINTDKMKESEQINWSVQFTFQKMALKSVYSSHNYVSPQISFLGVLDQLYCCHHLRSSRIIIGLLISFLPLTFQLVTAFSMLY